MADWIDIQRDVVYLAEIGLDQCANTFGSSPCTATGTPCYYSWPTCKDPNNFSQGVYWWRFSSQDGPLFPGWPNLIVDLEHFETTIKPDEALTVVGQLRVLLSDMEPLPFSCPGKPKVAQNAESAGTFLANLLARNPNFKGRPVRVWVGLRTWTPENFNLYFSGILDSWESGPKGVALVVKDGLKKLDAQYPPEQSSTNCLTAAYNGGATMYVADESEFVDPSKVGGVATVRIMDSTSPEYVNYTGRAEKRLTGCVAGRFGTRSVSHVAGLAVKNVYVGAENDAGMTTWDQVIGLPADRRFLDYLCDLAGISGLDTAFLDLGVTLVTDGGSSLTVSDDSDFPDRGFVRIDDEIIEFLGKASGTLSPLRRGRYGATQAAHAAAAPVYLSQFSEQAGKWLNGCLYKRRVEKPTSIKELVSDLRNACFASIWQAGDGKVRFKCAPVPLYSTAPRKLDENAHLVGDYSTLDANEDMRRTGLAVYYNPLEADAAKESARWGGALAHVNLPIESFLYLNERRREAFWCADIYREAEALVVAAHQLMRRQYGLPLLKFRLDVKDAVSIETGDFVKITSSLTRTPAGGPRPDVTYEIIRKKRIDDITYEFTALDCSGGVDGARYPVISPATVDYDYDSASADDREQYGWIGSNDSLNKVGSAGDPGYSIS